MGGPAVSVGPEFKDGTGSWQEVESITSLEVEHEDPSLEGAVGGSLCSILSSRGSGSGIE